MVINLNEVFISHKTINEFCRRILAEKKVRKDVINHVSEALIQTSLRGVDSHGIRLLPHYLRALDSGRINPIPNYNFMRTSSATGKLDADHTFGHAAGSEGMLQAIALAKENGIGAVAVYNSTHFGAAAYFSLLAANQDMIGISFTHADSLMLSYNGKRPYFGTNPLCFAAPCEGEDPFCLDMATTTITWNKIIQRRATGEKIPEDWGCDSNGFVVAEPNKVVSLLPIGKYKGFGISMMIDILCSLLTGMPYGRGICRMYTDPIEKKRLLGHFFMAIDINCFEDITVFKKRLKMMMNEVRNEPPQNPKNKILVPGDPEKEAYAIRIKKGIPLDKVTMDVFKKLAGEIKFTF
jgi:ureidoglycolate dehydrogenase (NAD+)